MKNWLQTIKTSNYSKAKVITSSFFGPIGMAAGVICIINSFNLTSNSIDFEQSGGMTNFVAGIILLVIGAILALLTAILSSLNQDKKVVFARFFIPSGLALFFWGIHVHSIVKTNLGSGVGWGTIVVAIILMIFGFGWSPKQ
jgi:hypothetical protein